MSIETRKLDVQILDPNGGIVFEKKNFEVPVGWSDRAAQIVASKYAMDNEFSAVQIIDRVVEQITDWGIQQNYFGEEDDTCFDLSNKFSEELKDILINQRAAFNSPVWFNCGSNNGSQQMSACFIVPVEDTMESILEHNTIEGKIFRGGSGAGCNVSSLRAKGEKLSNKGTSSGPLSFMKMWDSTAGAIRSGGKTRRSAKLICMDVDHPDIMDFIECKQHEENKAKALIEAGVPIEEAYATVSFQNTNHSIRVSDQFMKAVEAEDDWSLINRGDNKEANRIPAANILNRTAQIAWATGDPGIQFDTRMNIDNPVPVNDRIYSTNPCFSGDMKLLTDSGYKTFEELEGTKPNIISPIDKTIRQSKVWCSGTKPVHEIKFHWKAGIDSIKCTADHVWQLIDGSECKAEDLKGKRIKPFLIPKKVEYSDSLMAGYIQGDGNTKRLLSEAHKGIEVYIGKKDMDVASIFGVTPSEISDDGKGTWYSIAAAEIAKKYGLKTERLEERSLPDSILEIGYNSKQEVGQFFSGLFSANGSVISNTRVTLKTTCRKLADQTKELLYSYWGIESYITVNKPMKIEWENGVYESKESYDLNIHQWQHLIKFAEHIGFIHQYKMDALVKTIIDRSPTVSSVNYISDQKVYDFTESAHHWGVINGFVGHNCSEFSAINNSSCNLASLNLVKYYTNSDFKWDRFNKDIQVMITAMDILIDAADYPTEDIKNTTKATRPLGLGFSNLGALLILMGVPYDSDRGRNIATEITRKMTRAAYRQSIKLAKQLGSFAYFKENRDTNIKIAERLTLDKKVGKEIKEYGLRNSQLTLLAPTGTISFMMDCDTTGIEPLFALQTIKTLAGGGTIMIDYPCVTEAWNIHGYATRDEEKIIDVIKDTDDEDLHNLFKTANEIPWKAHIDMMAACQKHLNGAISKTVNMPSNTTAEQISEAYIYAWKAGLKAIAIYRDGSKGMQPIVDATKKKEEKVEKHTEPQWSAVRKQLPRTRDSLTHAFNISGFEGYLTVGLYDDGSPGEMFINMQKQGSTLSGLMDSFAVLLSFALQYGVPLERLISKFRGTKFEPAGYTNNPDIWMTSSVMDYIFRWLNKEFYDIEDEKYEEPQIQKEITEEIIDLKPIDASGPACIECGHTTILNGTCYQCLNCGTNTGCS